MEKDALDLNVGVYDSYEGLLETLGQNLTIWERQYGIDKVSDDVAQRFKNIIMSVAINTDERVAILVDEYDKPLLKSVDNVQL